LNIATVAVAECTPSLFPEVNTTIIKTMQSAMLCYVMLSIQHNNVPYMYEGHDSWPTDL